MAKERIQWGTKTIILDSRDSEKLFDKFMRDFLNINKRVK